MEASRALKWSKIIQHWEIYKRKKKVLLAARGWASAMRRY